MDSAIPFLKNVKKIYIIGLEKKIFFDAFEKYTEIVYVKEMKKAIKTAFFKLKKRKKDYFNITIPSRRIF